MSAPKFDIAPNLATNPGFEDAASTSLAYSGSAPTGARSVELPRTGAYSYKLTANADGATTMMAGGNSGIAVKGGTTYAASGWARAASTGRSVVCAVSWFDASSAFISSQNGSTVTSSSSAWTQASGTFTAPANAVTCYLYVRVSGALAANEVHYVDDLSIRDTDPSLYGRPLSDAVRLEVEQDPTGLTNEIANPSGDLGGWGWVTPVAGSKLEGANDSYTSYKQGLKYTWTTASAGGQYFYSEPFEVAATEWLAAFWHVNTAAFGHHRARIDWLNSSQAVLSSTAWTSYTAGNQDCNMAPVQAPASTAYAQIRFEVGASGGVYPLTGAGTGSALSVREVTVAKAASSASLAATTYNLVPNPSFETDLSGWKTGGDCTIARSTAQAYIGAASLLWTRGATYGGTVAACTLPQDTLDPTTAGYMGIPVSASTAYTLSFQSRAATTTRKVGGQVVWFNSSGAFLSTSNQDASSSVTNNASAWTGHAYTVTSPAGAAYARVAAVFPSTLPAAGEQHYFDAFQLEAGSVATSYFDGDLVDAGTVSYDWVNQPAKVVQTRTNKLTNPSFETNATGWAASYSGMTAARATDQFSVGTASLKVTATASNAILGANTLTGASGFAVTAGTYYAARAKVRLSSGFTANNEVSMYLTWYNSSNAEIGDTIIGSVVANNAALNTWVDVKRQGESAAPAGAVRAALWVNASIDTGTFASGTALWVDAALVEERASYTDPGAYFDGATADATTDFTLYDRGWTGTAHASTSTETWTTTLRKARKTDSNLEFIEPVPYVNVLGDVRDVSCSREELNVGSMQAVVASPGLDPAVADTLNPGREYRLTAFNPETGVFEPLVAGKLANARAEYFPANPADQSVLVTASGTDATTQLANAQRPDAVAAIADLPQVLEGCAVPWNVNGSGSQVSSATIVATNDNASALDQAALTRDTALGLAWLDRSGVFQAWDRAALDLARAVERTANPGFETDASGWAGAFGRTSVARTTAQFRSGSASLQLTCTGTSGTIGAYNPSERVYRVAPGQTVTASGWARSAATPRSASVMVQWFDDDPANLNPISTTTSSFVTTTTSGWVQVSVQAVAPAGAAWARPVHQFGSAAVGEVHYVDDASFTTPGYAVLDETVYNSSIKVDYDSDRLVNSVIVRRQWNHPTEGPKEDVYGPYEDAASVKARGRHQKEFTVAGTDPGSIPAYADEILAANSTPRKLVRSVTVPVNGTDSLKWAFTELYDLCLVTSGDLVQFSRVTRVGHRLEATQDGGRWLVELEFAAEGGVASPTVQPPVQGATIDVSDGTWIAIGSAGAPAFQNSWVNYGSPYPAAAYMRKNGMVYLKGLVKLGTVPSVIFTLPAGYRPAENHIMAALGAQVNETTGASSAANTGAASAGTAHTHPIPHTHSIPIGNAAYRVDVESNGNVRMNMSTGTNGWVSLSVIVFPAEQ